MDPIDLHALALAWEALTVALRSSSHAHCPALHTLAGMCLSLMHTWKQFPWGHWLSSRAQGFQRVLCRWEFSTKKKGNSNLMDSFRKTATVSWSHLLIHSDAADGCISIVTHLCPLNDPGFLSCHEVHDYLSWEGLLPRDKHEEEVDHSRPPQRQIFPGPSAPRAIEYR